MFPQHIDTRKLYERIKTMRPGDLLTYEDLSKIIDRDVTNGARSLLTSARRAAQKNDQVVTDTVPKVGIKRMENVEVARSGETSRKRINREAARGAKRLSCVDFNSLPNDDKVAHNASMSILGAIQHGSSTRRVKQIETAVTEANGVLSLSRTLEAFKK